MDSLAQEKLFIKEKLFKKGDIDKFYIFYIAEEWFCVIINVGFKSIPHVTGKVTMEKIRDHIESKSAFQNKSKEKNSRILLNHSEHWKYIGILYTEI